MNLSIVNIFEICPFRCPFWIIGMWKRLTASNLENGIATSIWTTKWKRKRKQPKIDRFHIPTEYLSPNSISINLSNMPIVTILYIENINVFFRASVVTALTMIIQSLSPCPPPHPRKFFSSDFFFTFEYFVQISSLVCITCWSNCMKLNRKPKQINKKKAFSKSLTLFIEENKKLTLQGGANSPLSH